MDDMQFESFKCSHVWFSWHNKISVALFPPECPNVGKCNNFVRSSLFVVSIKVNACIQMKLYQEIPGIKFFDVQSSSQQCSLLDVFVCEKKFISTLMACNRVHKQWANIRWTSEKSKKASETSESLLFMAYDSFRVYVNSFWLSRLLFFSDSFQCFFSLP